MTVSMRGRAPIGPYVLLPIETKAREFLAKTLLGCVAAEAGFHVVVGDQNELLRYLDYLPRGIYIDKSIVRTKIRNFRKNRSLGNRVVAWCEEGLSFRVPETYLMERISGTAFGLVDCFFAWGPSHAELISKKLTEEPEKIVCAGNPRFDLLLSPYRRIFEQEKEELTRRYGAFILINTNFTRYNHYNGRDFVIRNLREAGRIKDEAHELFLVKWADYLGDMFHRFVEMVGEVSRAFPGLTVIVRPHPSESLDSWKQETRSFPNVRVVHEGNVIPWIMASEVTIHNSCTTGVEAFVMEEPVIAYRPITSETFDSFLPNAVCPVAHSPDELISMIEVCVRRGSGFKGLALDRGKCMEVAGRYISGLEEVTACENVVARLQAILAAHPELVEQGLQSGLSGLVSRMKARAVSVKRSILHGWKGSKWLRDYMKKKFPGLDLSEVEYAVGMFQIATGGFEKVRVYPFPKTPSCFIISKAGL